MRNGYWTCHECFPAFAGKQEPRKCDQCKKMKTDGGLICRVFFCSDCCPTFNASGHYPDHRPRPNKKKRHKHKVQYVAGPQEPHTAKKKKQKRHERWMVKIEEILPGSAWDDLSQEAKKVITIIKVLEFVDQ
jgi:hypothetical protein